MVISLDKDAKKIALSIKAAVNAENDGSFTQPVQTATLADKLKGFNLGSSED